MSGRRVLVIQSHRAPLPSPWYDSCIESVRGWAALKGLDYRWLGDELFDPLPEDLLTKTGSRRMVAADLARLHALEAALAEGYGQALWVDADVLVLAPGALALPSAGALFGREVWVQEDGAGGLRTYRRIHNAFMAFARGDPVLPFYRQAAERILKRHQGPMVPQLIGPKLLTLLHNAIGFEVFEEAGMLSPLVARDLLAGGGEALDRYLERSPAVPLAVNLCGSLAGEDGLGHAEFARLVSLLEGEGPAAFGAG